MDFDPAKFLRETPQAETAPIASLGGSRSQSMQRLQIGLFGLAAMVLLVGLANIVIENADRNQARVVPEAAPTVAATVSPPKSDPLVEAGVIPDMPDEPRPAADATDNAVRDEIAPLVP